jgi:PST family polysaccharide transporter
MSKLNNETASAIKEKSVRAVKWTYFQTLAPNLISPFTTIILARLLMPADFGLIAVATTILSLLRIFQDMGLSKALIQSEDEDNEKIVFNVVFWTNLAISLMLYAVLLLGAPLIATYFNSPSATPIIRILGLNLILDALCAVHRNALIRWFQFKKLFYVSMLPVLVPFCVTIPLAYFGYGVWSLVVGNLAATCLSSILLWINVSWRPTLSFERIIARRILVFGLWATIEALVGWFYVQGDNAIVGRFFSMHEFGIYVVSYNAVVLVIGAFLSPVSTIAYTAFSKIQKDKTILGALLLNIIRLCALVSLPIGVGIFLVSGPATSIIFGNKWLEMDAILGILALSQGLSWIVTANPDAYRAMGRPDILSKFQLLKLLYTIPAYVIAAQFSLMTFAYSKLGVAIIGVFLWFYLMLKTFPVTLHELVEHIRTPCLATVGMALIVIFIDNFLHPLLISTNLMKLIILSLTGVITYSVLIYFLDKKLFKSLFQLVLRFA